MSEYLVLRAGGCWYRGQRGVPACWQWQKSSLGRVLPLLWAGFEPNYTATLLGRSTKGTWAHGTCIAEHVDVDGCGGTNSGMQLHMVTFSWLLLRCVGAMGGADGFYVLATSAVGMGGCFPVGHRPSSYSLPLDIFNGRECLDDHNFRQTVAISALSASILLKYNSWALECELRVCICEMTVTRYTYCE